ncbi:MAG: translation elongation factor 4 [Patescibacteria group bacterium]
MNQSHIRNFCIIAHIDHGKSTLADRLLELTHTVEKREMKEQMLDQMDLERERGITIKLQPVRMMTEVGGEPYELNLIDTPGHVDFTYEVSRSLAACEGALLVVDATQGIQAQTLANLYLALEQDLVIIPVINKIDLPNAEPDRVAQEMCKLIGCDLSEILRVSAKTGKNVEQILQAVVDHVPPPDGDPSAPVRALIFDSNYDDYRGVIAYIRVMDGALKKNDAIALLKIKSKSTALDVGIFHPAMIPTGKLETGEVGYIVTGFKDVTQCRVGDTMTSATTPATTPLPGYKEVKPMVFAGIYCQEGHDYEQLRDAMGKLKLNDAALSYEPVHEKALGFGFRCGFLGLLHLDIVQERLKREHGLNLMVTVPSVAYHVFLRGGKEIEASSPMDLPDPAITDHLEEPWMKLDIVSPASSVGNIMTLVQEKHGRYLTMEYLDEARVLMHGEIPLSSILVDFYDKLKGVTSGYASMNYEFARYEVAQVVRLRILVAGEEVEALSTVVYEEEASRAGRKIVESLKGILPRQMFEVRLQAALGSKIIASEKIPPMRKDVTEKLYGGDVTRKRKLLEKQKKGKKRMRAIGKVDIPQEAFLAMLKR